MTTALKLRTNPLFGALRAACERRNTQERAVKKTMRRRKRVMKKKMNTREMIIITKMRTTTMRKKMVAQMMKNQMSPPQTKSKTLCAISKELMRQNYAGKGELDSSSTCYQGLSHQRMRGRRSHH